MRAPTEGNAVRISLLLGLFMLVLAICLTLAGCNTGRWVYTEETHCRGGRVVVEKRTVDVRVVGQTRNTTIRTDACLD